MTSLIATELRRIGVRRVGYYIALAFVMGVIFAAILTFLTGDESFRYSNAVLTAIPIAAGYFVILFVGAASASLVGAEWRFHSLTNLVTWEPRRPRVFLAKATASMTALPLATIALMVVLAVALLPTGLLKGSLAGTNASWFVQVAGLWLRAGLMALITVGCVTGLVFAIRNTAGAFIAWFVTNNVTSLAGLYRPSLRPWLLGHAMSDLSGLGGGGLLGPLLVGSLYAALFLGAGLVSFVRRDLA